MTGDQPLLPKQDIKYHVQHIHIYIIHTYTCMKYVGHVKFRTIDNRCEKIKNRVNKNIDYKVNRLY